MREGNFEKVFQLEAENSFEMVRQRHDASTLLSVTLLFGVTYLVIGRPWV
jgi:hypothetical protein